MSREYIGENDCGCRHTGEFRGFLRHRSDGEGLALYCSACSGWVEDSWLYTDEGGIPVRVEMEVSRDYASGEDLVLYGLLPER